MNLFVGSKSGFFPDTGDLFRRFMKMFDVLLINDKTNIKQLSRSVSISRISFVTSTS